MVATLQHVTKPFLRRFDGHRNLDALLYFLVSRVLPARIAELRRLQPVLMLLPVLGRRVVPVLTVVALQSDDFSHGRLLAYSMMSATAPAPTVWPPSRIANRNPFSSATGVISVISHDMLSPGITIFSTCGSFTSLVAFVVPHSNLV